MGTLHVPLHFLGSPPLVRRILVQERRLELALPWRVGRKPESGRELPPGVQVEQLDRHLADRGARLVSLPLPRRRAEPVQPRRRRVPIGCGPVRLELIQPVQRHVQAGPALVLYDGHLEGPALRPDGDRLDPAVDPDAVLEMDHVIAGPERPRRGAGRRFAVPARPPQPAGPAEDLVIREHAQPGQHESELAFVVAQDHGRRLGRDDLAQPLDVAVDRLGRRDREPHTSARGVERDAWEPGELRPPRRWIDEQRLPRRRLLAQPPRDLEVVGRLGPRAIHFLPQRRLLLEHDERIGRQEIQQGLPL